MAAAAQSRRERQLALVRRAKRGDRAAAAELLRETDALITTIATGLVQRYAALSYADVEDMRAEAHLVLVTKVIPRFDSRRGLAWTTYAMHWVRMACKRWVENAGYTVRVPVHAHEKAVRIRKARRQLRLAGREPTDEELMQAARVTRRAFTSSAYAGRAALSLNAPVHHDSDHTHVEFLVDDAVQVDDRLDILRRSVAVRAALAQLGDRDRLVLERRFGLDCREWTLLRVGRKLKLTRERVRQIEGEALVRLRRALERVEAAA